VLANNISCSDIAVDATYVCVTSSDGSQVLRIPVAGGELPSLITQTQNANYLAVDATNGVTGTVNTCPIDTSVSLGTPLVHGLLKPGGLAQDATSLYVCDSGHGALLRVSK
jgi:hypothetical protein